MEQEFSEFIKNSGNLMILGSLNYGTFKNHVSHMYCCCCCSIVVSYTIGGRFELLMVNI